MTNRLVDIDRRERSVDLALRAFQRGAGGNKKLLEVAEDIYQYIYAERTESEPKESGEPKSGSYSAPKQPWTVYNVPVDGAALARDVSEILKENFPGFFEKRSK